jgi:uncharacterized phosphosugar-binding protein
MMEKYFEEIVNILHKVKENQRENVIKVANTVADSLVADRLLHTYGTGHSQILVEEVFYRAGGLVAINPMFDAGTSLFFGATKTTLVERLPNYAEIILNYYDVQKGDVIIIISNSGRNSVPIEMAVNAKRKGLKVIALTSIDYSKCASSRHPSGKLLFDIADIVIDNYIPAGDAVISLEGLPQKMGPASTVINAAILHTIMMQAAQIMLQKGVTPPVWTSGNIPGGEQLNIKFLEKYKDRIKRL